MCVATSATGCSFLLDRRTNNPGRPLVREGHLDIAAPRPSPPHLRNGPAAARCAMVTINTARPYGLKGPGRHRARLPRGLVTPLPIRANCAVKRTFAGGRRVDADRRLPSAAASNTPTAQSTSRRQDSHWSVRAPERRAAACHREGWPEQISPRAVMEVTDYEGYAIADPARDLLKIAVVRAASRYRQHRRRACSRASACARVHSHRRSRTTPQYRRHGTSDDEKMLLAVKPRRDRRRAGGGGGRERCSARCRCPTIDGLMSDQPFETVRADDDYGAPDRVSRAKLGCLRMPIRIWRWASWSCPYPRLKIPTRAWGCPRRSSSCSPSTRTATTEMPR